jgi:hypothetical protein
VADVATVDSLENVQDGAPEAVYTGSPRNLALGVAFAVAGGSSFMMGMTDVFFSEATAWTFVIWGILFILVGLADMAQTYIVSPDALDIKNAIRFWDRDKTWAWENVYRMDVLVSKPDARLEDAKMQIYHQQPGDVAIGREDRDYLPELAQQVIDHAGLAPQGDANPTDLSHLPRGKATYTWSK